MHPPSQAASADGTWNHLRAAPGTLHGQHDGLIGIDLALVVVQGHIRWLGPQADLAGSPWGRGGVNESLRQFNGQGAMLTPGLVDCHTHLVYGGDRATEYALRLAGADYEAIARAGGGILSTVRATRAADEDTLYALAVPRLTQLLDEGVCAIEIKSGYGLTLKDERRMLRVARRLGEDFGVTVRTTFLGAHALPPDYAGRSADYIRLVCEDMMPALAAEGLIDAVDVFCERIAFSLAETEQVFRAAQALGLRVKLHAEQLSDMGGSALAARYGALSCDHIEHLSAEGIAAMRTAGTTAVLLPGAYYTLRDTHLPPIEALRAAGVPMAVSTDHNPGTSPVLSLLLMANMACNLFRLTVPEALAGITRHAATALDLQATHGSLGVGRPANFVLWDLKDSAELVYWLGQRPRRSIVRQGRLLVDDLACAGQR